MPSILRIFPYQILASLAVLGHSGSYDQGVVGLGHEHLEQYAVQTLDHRSYGQQPCGHHHTDQDEDHLGLRRYLFRMYWATPMTQNIAVQNRK